MFRKRPAALRFTQRASDRQQKSAKVQKSIGELEYELSLTVTSEYHDSIVGEAVQRISELEKENEVLRDLLKKYED